MDLGPLGKAIVSSVVFSGIGLVMFMIAWRAINWLSPFSIRKELEEDQNTAVGIVIGAVSDKVVSDVRWVSAGFWYAEAGPWVWLALLTTLAVSLPSGARLTERELDVLRLLAEGLRQEEIGRRLGIGPETVRTHLRKACARLGAATRTQAVAAALRQGLIA